MATVHRATIELADGATREVALKRLLPQLADDKRFVDDFVREAKLAAHLHHPNIVRILELGRIGRTYFIAMDLVRGVPLMSLMRKAHLKKRHAPIGVVVSLMIEVCDALDHAHNGVSETGEPIRIVHRDLTPSNLLITEDGHVKVIDFGVAKALSGQLQTSSGLAKGKLGYMSVEAIGGKRLDTRADIFSAGVVMWELIAGRRLWKGKNEYDVLAKIRDGAVRRPSELAPDCPSELDDIVLRALARSPDDRWPSASAMRQALDELRRYYRELSTPREVVKWKRALRADSTLQHHLRVESDGESTATRLSTDDLLEDVEPPEEVPEGSQRAEHYDEAADSGAYDDLHFSESAEPPSVRDEPDEPRTGPKWKDVDTIVSVFTKR